MKINRRKTTSDREIKYQFQGHIMVELSEHGLCDLNMAWYNFSKISHCLSVLEEESIVSTSGE